MLHGVVAVAAQSMSSSPDVAERIEAMQLGRRSFRVSAAGIGCGITIIILMIIMRPSISDH